MFNIQSTNVSSSALSCVGFGSNSDQINLTGVRVEWQVRDRVVQINSSLHQLHRLQLRLNCTTHDGDNYPGTDAGQTCPYERANLSVIYARWHKIDHCWFQQYNACVQDWIRWRAHEYRRLSRAKHWSGLYCESPYEYSAALNNGSYRTTFSLLVPRMETLASSPWRP